MSSSLSSTIETARLLLRRWRDDDLLPFAALNADPLVMEHFPGVMTRTESDALADRILRHFEQHGFGPWAVEVKDGAPFVGFVGLMVPRFEAHFTPCVEVGWRLAAQHWGHGYATEGAQAALAFAFQFLNLDEVVSMTTPGNWRSIRVMQKLGMSRKLEDDFDHPLLPDSHPLQRHFLYRIRKPEAVANHAESSPQKP